MGSSDRKLGFWMALALVVGNYIGSGIFLLPAQLAPLGWNAVFGWLLTIAGVLCLAVVFARLSRIMPVDGGPYHYVQQAFGPLPGFVVAWSYWIAIWVGIAALAVAAISYLSFFVPALAETPGLGALAAAGLLWLLTAVNIVSVRLAGSVQLATTILKLLPLVAVVAIAAFANLDGRAPIHTPFRAADLSIASITTAAALTLWAMLGVESAVTGTRKIANPERNIPRVTIIGAAVVGLIYVLVSTPVGLLMPVEQAAASNAPLADFVAFFWSPRLAALVGLFAAISAIGCLNGWVFLQGEVPLSLAREGSFPAFFGKVTNRGTALRAQVLSSGCATALIAFNADRSVAGLFVFMILLSTVSSLFLYFGSTLAALKLQREGRIDRSAAMALAAVLGLVFSIWTFVGAGLEATAWGLLLMAAGIPIYLVMRRRATPSPAPEAVPAAPAE